MSIISLILYGSCARKDDDASSDIDVLALSNEISYRSTSHNKMNLSIYPLKLALERAREGDLFMLHIIREGLQMYDPEDKLSVIKNSYIYKYSYRHEIDSASELGWFILNWADSLSNFSLANRRIAWCVRTILIAKSAEKRTPVFSAKDLSVFSGKEHYIKIIKVKNSDKKDSDLLLMFREFLLEFGSIDKNTILSPNLSEQKEHFRMIGNAIAEKTAESFLHSFLADGYS